MTQPLMRNRANNTQARIPWISKPRSIFPINKSVKQTQKASYLVPIFFEEVMPGDTWELNLDMFIRLMPQVTAPSDNLYASTFFFYDPTRLIWPNFTKQHGERENPEDTIDYLSPKLLGYGDNKDEEFPAKSLQDYLGKPPLQGYYETTSFGERIYNHVYNEYFRASTIEDSVYLNKSDSDDDPINYPLRRISKMHDYFTDCLKNLQMGDPVTMPLGTTAPIITNDEIPKITLGQSGTGTPIETRNMVYSKNSSYETLRLGSVTSGNGTYQVRWGDETGLIADLSNATAATIASLRLMIDTQAILEGDNRSGVRYTEIMQSRYGVLNPDLRLMRPQYLGGTKTPIFTTPVIQTSGTGITDQATPQGNIAGQATAGDSGKVIKASFGEFGHILGLLAITAVPQYQQGLHRKFSRFERFDYAYPEFMGLSDQDVKEKEIYVQADTTTDAITGEKSNDKVFGYIGRYDEYRYFNNEVRGELRSTYPQSLDVWTYSEKFENEPVLNADFLHDKTAEVLQRSLAVTNDEDEDIEDQFIVDCQYTGAVTRILTSKPVPQTGGRIL